jgi:hypothetical protein
VGEGIRTPGRWSHNPELCQLSYAHRMSTRKKPSNSGIFIPRLQEGLTLRELRIVDCGFRIDFPFSYCGAVQRCDAAILHRLLARAALKISD